MTTQLANYWLLVQLGGAKKKWNTLSHQGLLFPPPYVKHNVPVIYNNQKIVLNKNSEELATLYAKYIQSAYVNNRTFNDNFWADWQKTLEPNTVIRNLKNVDFSLIYDYLITVKSQTKELSAINTDAYKTALVDNQWQPVGNFRVEPPGIFLGRGCNRFLGKVKPRLYPEDIIINIGKESIVPPSLPNHQWKAVIHDKTVEWLASWKDQVTGKIKYMWLAAHSKLKIRSDIAKFDQARKLGRRIKSIRTTINQLMNNDQLKIKQIATSIYLIDYLSLRVGTEKSTADTVGVTSLRSEHLKLLPNHQIKLDFLGKDSIRYVKTVTVSNLAYQNLVQLKMNKLATDLLFDTINATDVNKFLQSLMSNLTAKVFRTYNASHLFEQELARIPKQFDKANDSTKVSLILDYFNKANAKVAILCNHQKTVTKTTLVQIKKLNEAIDHTKQLLAIARKKQNSTKIMRLSDHLQKLKSKKALKVQLQNISLGTSKINYIDPRISVAFLKKHQLPLDKIFSKTLQEKFKWAMNVDTHFTF